MPWEALLEALLDTLKIFPFLLTVYIFVALLEERVATTKYAKLLGGRYATLIGSATGIAPICGFSVMGAKLYREGCITVGTLAAIFISASDEAVAVLITEGLWADFFILVSVKALVAIAVGYTWDLLFKKRFVGGEVDEKEDDISHCHCCGDGDALHKFFLHPLVHCLKTAAFILVVNALLGSIVFWVGEEKFAAFISKSHYLHPVVAALVGLIPGCAGSAAIVGVYVGGGLSFGGLTAGLIVNSGVGMALLLKDKKTLKTSLVLLAVMYIIGVAVGEIISILV